MENKELGMLSSFNKTTIKEAEKKKMSFYDYADNARMTTLGMKKRQQLSKKAFIKWVSDQYTQHYGKPSKEEISKFEKKYDEVYNESVVENVGLSKHIAKQIKNFKSLPKEIQTEINSASRIEGSGHTEIQGLEGSKLIFSMNGSWDDDMFTVDSYGSHKYQWKAGGKLKKLKEKAENMDTNSLLSTLNEKCAKKKPVKEEGDKAAYQAFFDKMLKKFGVKSPDELSDKDKKKFYDAIDKGWNSESEPGKDGKTNEAKNDIVTYGDSKGPSSGGVANRVRNQRRVRNPMKEADDTAPDDESGDNPKDKSEDQKEYKALYKKMCAKYKVKDASELDDKAKAKFDKDMKAAWAEIESNGDETVGESVVTKRSLFDILSEDDASANNKKDTPPAKKDDKPAKKGADVTIDDNDDEDETTDFTIEFPEGVFLEMEFDGVDVNTDQIKVRAQKMYQQNADIVSIALDLAKEFNASEWSIQDISQMDAEEDDDDTTDEQDMENGGTGMNKQS